MDAYLIIAIICLLLGLVGCVLPVLPGLPIAYAGVVLAFFSERIAMPWQALLVWGLITGLLMVLDFAIPVWGTQKFGGSRWGMIGCSIGMIVGLFFGFPGIIAGPIAGAILFEMIGGMESGQALKAGMGSFIGFLTGTVLKIVCVVAMGWYVGSRYVAC